MRHEAILQGLSFEGFIIDSQLGFIALERLTGFVLQVDREVAWVWLLWLEDVSLAGCALFRPNLFIRDSNLFTRHQDHGIGPKVPQVGVIGVIVDRSPPTFTWLSVLPFLSLLILLDWSRMQACRPDR